MCHDCAEDCRRCALVSIRINCAGHRAWHQHAHTHRRHDAASLDHERRTTTTIINTSMFSLRAVRRGDLPRTMSHRCVHALHTGECANICAAIASTDVSGCGWPARSAEPQRFSSLSNVSFVLIAECNSGGWCSCGWRQWRRAKLGRRTTGGIADASAADDGRRASVWHSCWSKTKTTTPATITTATTAAATLPTTSTPTIRTLRVRSIAARWPPTD